jgi:uncharacterized membrane protein
MITSKTKPSLTLGSFSFGVPVLLALITLIAFALRVARLDFQPLWWDEGYSMFFATRDLGAMLTRTAVDIHPPLYYALLQLWIAVAGKSEIVVRLLSGAIGVATVPLIYALARQLFDSRVALIAALLLALSPLHIYYSQEVRMYGLVTLLGMASVYLFVVLLRPTPADRRPPLALMWTSYILVTTAALYTQYYAAFILAFEILVVLIFTMYRPSLVTRHSSLVHWPVAWLTIGTLYLPWVLYAGIKLYTYVTGKVAHEAYQPLDPVTFLAQHLVAFSVGHLTTWTWLAWGSALIAALAFLGIIAMTRRQGDKETGRDGGSLPVSLSPGLLVAFYLFIPLALGFLVNLRFSFHPIRYERLLLLAAPAFYLLAALGIHALGKRHTMFGRLALTVVSIISAASLYDFYTAPRYPDDDYRPLIAEMQALAQPGDIFLAIYPWQIGYLETYYAGAPLTIVETPNDAWINNPAQIRRDLDALMAQHLRVWLPALQTLGRILEDSLDAYLRPRNYSVFDNWFGTTRLELFAVADDPPSANRSIAFEGILTLGNRGVSTEPVAAGQDIVRVWFDWGSNVPAGFTASLRLLDSRGNLWAQDDREITSGMQRIGLAVPAGTPPDEYDLYLAIYRARDPGTLYAPSDPIARVKVIMPTQPNLAAIPHRALIDFENGIRLLGYATGDKPLRPGEPAGITLFWQTTRTLNADYTVALQIQDAHGNAFASAQAAPARGVYPTTRWQSNEVVRDPQALTLRGNAPDGDYRIVVALVDPANQVRVKTTTGRDLSQVGTVQVKGRLHYFGAPTPSKPLGVRFSDVARLVGYDFSGTPSAIRFVLYWQALAPTQTSYTVFAHLVDINGTLRAQRDQIPGAGAYPTTSWVRAEYLVDVYDISIPHDAPSGEYKIEIGMYNPVTGTRLPAFDSSNQFSGDHIRLSVSIPP